MPATALEQMILELVNRARLDPAAEAARYGIALNEGVPAGDTISTASKQPLAMNETLLGTARTHSQDMIDRDYFAHDTPEGVDPFQRMNNAGYNFTTAGENIADLTSSNPISNQDSILLHQFLFVDTNFPGRGHRINILDSDFQEIGVGQASGEYHGLGSPGGSNASMLTEDFGTRGNQQFLTGVSYADADHDNFYSIGEGRGSMLVALAAPGNPSTSTGGAGGYSLTVNSGVQTVTFSGGGLTSQISVAVAIAAHTNAKVDVIDQGVIATSVSLTDLGGATKIIGLGTFGLTLTGDSGNDTFVGTKGNDTIDGAGGSDTAIFSGNLAAYTLTTLAHGVQVAGPDGADTLLNVEHFQFKDQTVNAPGSVLAKHSDFDGNQHSDILWHNDNGADSIWDNGQIGGAHIIAAAGTVPASWHIADKGDFDGNGHSDILWRNDDGSTSIWDDGAIGSAHIVSGPGVVPNSWHISGTGDFDGNGHHDILWRNDDGSASIWDNGAIGSAHIISGPGVVANSWHISGTGDFDGNGHDDILWRNDNGAASIWDNGDINQAHIIASAGSIPSGWSIAGTGDFDGNSQSDILWHRDDGTVAIWDNGQIGGGHWVANAGVVPNSWHIAGTGDFDGNSHDDILWRNDNGAASIWDNGDINQAHIIADAGVIPGGWHIV
jgi:Cysteine-rich secretory protein family/RTX calcium-binding nonapeptide repeat (4 copies)